MAESRGGVVWDMTDEQLDGLLKREDEVNNSTRGLLSTSDDATAINASDNFSKMMGCLSDADWQSHQDVGMQWGITRD